MAVERVELLLQRATTALAAAGVPYAVIGGNAVAAWVGTIDTGAVRATKDVDILVRRSDLPGVDRAAATIGYMRIEVLGVTALVDSAQPLPSEGVHLIFANERVRPTDPFEAPDPAAAVQTASGFLVLALPELVRMKLVANRRVDQVHLEDLLRIGLIDADLAERLPEELRSRLRHVRDTMIWDRPAPEF